MRPPRRHKTIVVVPENDDELLVIGTAVDLKDYEYKGRNIGCLQTPGSAAVLVSIHTLKRALAQAEELFEPEETEIDALEEANGKPH
jgi:hypothetical protein